MDNPFKSEDAAAAASAAPITETTRAPGLSSLDLYERTPKSIADMQQAVGEGTQMQWFSAIAAAQANFTREMAETYTSPAAGAVGAQGFAYKNYRALGVATSFMDHMIFGLSTGIFYGLLHSLGGSGLAF